MNKLGVYFTWVVGALVIGWFIHGLTNLDRPISFLIGLGITMFGSLTYEYIRNSGYEKGKRDEKRKQAWEELNKHTLADSQKNNDVDKEPEGQ